MARKAQNTNRQGANFELQIMYDLNRYGYTTMRSSGSRGAVDVVAVGDAEILMIQAKISQAVIPPAERRAVVDLAERAGSTAVPMCAYRVGGKVWYRVLTGTGPKDFLLWEPEPTSQAMCVCGHPYAWHDSGLLCWQRVDAQPEYSCPCKGFELKTA